jgi:hypothetical protein
MHPQARQTLREIHTLQRFENYVRCARAELASDPSNTKLSAFINMIEMMVREKKAKLTQIGEAAAIKMGSPFRCPL